MSWRSLSYRAHPAASASQAIYAETLWIFRTSHSLAGWAEEAAEPAWQTEIPDDLSLGPRDVVCSTSDAVPEIVVACADPDGRGCTVLALAARTGLPCWQRSLRLKPSSGGLQAHGDLLYLHGYDESQRRYVWMRMDAGDGSTVFEQPSTQLRSAAITGGGLWLAGWDGVYALGHDGRILVEMPMEWPTLSSRADNVYVHAVDDTKTPIVTWWGKRADAPQAQIALTGLPVNDLPDVMLCPTQTAGQVVIAPFIVGAGVWMVDLTAQRAIWQQMDDGVTQIWRILVADKSVVVVVRSDRADRLYAFDPDSGAAQGEIATQVTVIQNIYAQEDRLLVSGLDEFEIFRRGE